MKIPIAALLVSIDTESNGVPSELNGNGTNRFELILRPKVDNHFLSAVPNVNTNLDTMQTIIAHELGHFVAKITNDITHRNHGIDDFVPMVDTENKAWQIAEVINPKVDKAIKSWALSTYQMRDDQMRKAGKF